MSILRLNYREDELDLDNTRVTSLSKLDFGRFSTDILGLGEISKRSEYGEALAAIFDLEGFTEFCNQMDPHLVIPEYLEKFLEWLFAAVKKEFTADIKMPENHDSVGLWARLPFFAKFTGDGVLFLWDTKFADAPTDHGNIVITLMNICDQYQSEFIPSIKADIVRIPKRLRCGVARGQVIAIGDGSDYVGSCINMASRLQKLGQLSFAFARRGFDLKKCFQEGWHPSFVTKRIVVRGIGQDEIVVVRKDEFENLPAEDKLFFQSV